MADYNLVNHYNSINIDNKHERLYELLTKDIFKLSNKLAFVMLAHLAIAKNLDISDCDPNNKGKTQLRSFTDVKSNNYLYALLIKLIKQDNEQVEIIFGDDKRFKHYLDILIKYAYQGAEYLLENELSSYKHSISEDLKPYFIMNFLNVFEEISDQDPF